MEFDYMFKFQTLATGLLLVSTSALPVLQAAPGGTPEYVTPRDAIIQRIGSKPQSIPLPPLLRNGLGVTHVAGRYHFTDQPFLVEGAERVLSLGYSSLKLWFTNAADAYPFNSDWSALGADPTYVQLARHPYYRTVFALPFKNFALEAQGPVGPTEMLKSAHGGDPESVFANEERQVADLCDYLFKEFKDRDVTFILQNWEGDWMFRREAKSKWDEGQYPELDVRRSAFIAWFKARQRGVERARSANPGSKCKVLHAIEVNLVLDTWKNIPTVTSQVLPEVAVDLVSWSCYDGFRCWNKSSVETAVGLWQGIETIEHFAKKQQSGKPVPVMIGEIGVPERKDGFDEKSIEAIYNGAMAVFAAKNTPNVFLWEIYCNEIAKGILKETRNYGANELNGFWLVRPDGSLGYTGRYFERLLKPHRL